MQTTRHDMGCVEWLASQGRERRCNMSVFGDWTAKQEMLEAIELVQGDHSLTDIETLHTLLIVAEHYQQAIVDTEKRGE